MTSTQLVPTTWMRDVDAATLDELRAWDWPAELRRQERQWTWLARHTEKSYSAVRRYADGSLTPPEEWLRQVARLLRAEVVAA